MLLNKNHKLTAANKLDARKKNFSEWTSRFGQVRKSDSRDRIGKQASVLISMCYFAWAKKIKGNVSKIFKESSKVYKYVLSLFFSNLLWQNIWMKIKQLETSHWPDRYDTSFQHSSGPVWFQTLRNWHSLGRSSMLWYVVWWTRPSQYSLKTKFQNSFNYFTYPRFPTFPSHHSMSILDLSLWFPL